MHILFASTSPCRRRGWQVYAPAASGVPPPLPCARSWRPGRGVGLDVPRLPVPFSSAGSKDSFVSAPAIAVVLFAGAALRFWLRPGRGLLPPGVLLPPSGGVWQPATTRLRRQWRQAASPHRGDREIHEASNLLTGNGEHERSRQPVPWRDDRNHRHCQQTNFKLQSTQGTPCKHQDCLYQLLFSAHNILENQVLLPSN